MRLFALEAHSFFSILVTAMLMLGMSRQVDEKPPSKPGGFSANVSPVCVPSDDDCKGVAAGVQCL